MHATGNEVTDVGLRAVQQRRNLCHRQQIEISQRWLFFCATGIAGHCFL
jgi:hypothetical protein